MVMGLTFRLTAIWQYLQGGGVAELPLQPPRNLAYSETADAVSFTWDAPVSFGSAGPHPTHPYQHQIRLTAVGGPALSDRQGDPTGWTNPSLDANRAESFNWISGETEVIQFRVAARDANGAVSAYLTSPVLTEGRVNPRRGPYGRQYGRAYLGGS